MINKQALMKKCEHLNDADKASITKALDQCFLTFKKDIVTYTDFLGRQKIATILDMLSGVDIQTKLICGHDDSERGYICFYKEFISEIQPTHNIIKITPNKNKFTKNKLSHRDFLGAILGLGLRRDKIGDIVIDDESNAYVFAKNDISEFIEMSLHKVGKVSVTTEILYDDLVELPKPKYKEINVTVSSLRLDALVSKGFSISRSDAASYIKSGKAFVNWVCITNSSKSINIEDRISVRGFGKIKVHGIGKITKKERLHVTIHRYI